MYYVVVTSAKILTDTYEHLQASTDIYGPLRTYLDIYGHQGHLRIPTNTYENVSVGNTTYWTPMDN